MSLGLVAVYELHNGLKHVLYNDGVALFWYRQSAYTLVYKLTCLSVHPPISHWYGEQVPASASKSQKVPASASWASTSTLNKCGDQLVNQLSAKAILHSLIEAI